MILEKLDKISTKTFIAIVLLYSLLTNLKDLKNGFLDGWNAVTIETDTLNK